MIVERDTITSKNEEVADKLNNFFIKAVENLGNKKITFTDTTPNVIKDEISKLDPKKASVKTTPTKILIGSQDIVF